MGCGFLATYEAELLRHALAEHAINLLVGLIAAALGGPGCLERLVGRALGTGGHLACLVGGAASLGCSRLCGSGILSGTIRGGPGFLDLGLEVGAGATGGQHGTHRQRTDLEGSPNLVGYLEIPCVMKSE